MRVGASQAVEHALIAQNKTLNAEVTRLKVTRPRVVEVGSPPG